MDKQENIDFEKIEKLWINSSERDFRTLNNLYNSGDYHWSLFIGHLVIEKLLKSCYVHIHKNHPPFTHDLLRLAKMVGLIIDDTQSDWLDTITTFNISARYENYKEEFYKKCTPDFTLTWINNIKELREWILSKL